MSTAGTELLRVIVFWKAVEVVYKVIHGIAIDYSTVSARPAQQDLGPRLGSLETVTRPGVASGHSQCAETMTIPFV